VAAGTAVVALAFTLALSGDQRPAGLRPLESWAPGRHRAATVPAVIQFAASVAYGTIVSFIALVAVERGLDVVGSFYTFLAVSSLSIRVAAGRAYDTWEAVPVLIPTFSVIAGGVALLAIADNRPLFCSPRCSRAWESALPRQR
jgi:hypothetical protein